MRASLEELKLLGVEELERRAAETHKHIRALDYDESEVGISARRRLVEAQNLLNTARAELLKDEDLPPPVVVAMKPAYMRPRFQSPTRVTLEQTFTREDR